MEIIKHFLQDDGTFPNNENLPLIIYRGAIEIKNGASDIEKVFHDNEWGNSWRNGIFSYHHYHSTAHEVLGIYQGTVKAQLGGPDGITAELEAGDVVLIPAGVAHKNLGSSTDFACVGAYPPGQDYAMNYGKIGERPSADKNIRKVPIPNNDPVEGKQGPLVKEWKK